MWLLAIAFISYLADRRGRDAASALIGRHPGAAKVGHFFLIGGLAGLLNFSLHCRRWHGWLLGSVIVATMCGHEELTQAGIPGRTFDLVDFAADFGGIFVFGRFATRLCGARGQL